MASKLALLFCIAAVLFTFATCGDNVTPSPTPSPNPSPDENTQGATKPPPASSGRVLETMNAGSYTYVLVDAAGTSSWWAAPRFEVAEGDTVLLPDSGMPMRGFESKTLGRKFDLVYFANSIKRTGIKDVDGAVQLAHKKPGAPAKPVVKAGDIAKAENGLTVAEVFAKGAELAGRNVTLRARVVKANSGILGKNWLHVQDGTGGPGTNDLTVTTKDTAKVGDVVLLMGRIGTDKDLGYGYKFPLLLEDAKVMVQ